MKKTQRTKPKGILGGGLESKSVGARERSILDQADAIRRQRSQAGRVKAAIREIRSYVVVSNHPIPKKIENLKADLAKAKNHEIKQALEKAIAELKN